MFNLMTQIRDEYPSVFGDPKVVVGYLLPSVIGFSVAVWIWSWLVHDNPGYPRDTKKMVRAILHGLMTGCFLLTAYGATKYAEALTDGWYFHWRFLGVLDCGHGFQVSYQQAERRIRHGQILFFGGLVQVVIIGLMIRYLTNDRRHPAIGNAHIGLRLIVGGVAVVCLQLDLATQIFVHKLHTSILVARPISYQIFWFSFTVFHAFWLFRRPTVPVPSPSSRSNKADRPRS